MAKLTLERVDDTLTLRVFRAPRAKAVFLMLPGGNCRPERYDWLAALNASGITVLIPDTRPANGPPPAFVPMVTNPQLFTLIAAARRHAPVVYAGGHSAGAALVQDALDPPSNTRAVYPPDYEPPRGLAGVAVMGCSLQSRALTIVMTYRSETRLLARPDDMPFLFLSGDHDALAPPTLMEKTRLRYDPPTALVVLKGGTHYGFCDEVDPGDNPAANAPGADITTQRERTARYLAQWITGQPIRVNEGDELRDSPLRRVGPAMRDR